MPNIGDLLTFPFTSAESRKNFLLGCLVLLAAFFIPLLPSIIAYGYIAKIVRKIADGEAPSMPAWDDLNEMLVDGLRLYGVKFIISLPMIVIMVAGMGTYSVGMIIMGFQDDPNLMNILLPILLLVFGATMCIALPLGIITSVISYPASIHAVVKRRFSAGFEFRAWWPILRINLGGFLVAILMTFVISFLYSIGVQILAFTLILICLLPLVVPVVMFYMILIPELLAAQAYRDGLLKLAAPVEAAQE